MSQRRDRNFFRKLVLFICVYVWGTLLLGCGGSKQAEEAFEELFDEKQRLVAKFLQEEKYDLFGLKATRETHTTGDAMEGTIRFTARSRDGKELSATYNFVWQDGSWNLKSSQPARLFGGGSSVSIPKLDQLME